MNLTFIDMSNNQPKLTSEQLVEKMKEKGIKFSEMAQKEIVEMQKTCKILFSIL